jgi:hypothetical protein
LRSPISSAGRLGEQRRLAEVVEQQPREHEAVPGDLDRLAAEVPHVGVQRLAAGDDEEDRPERDEPLPRVLDEEVDRVRRRHGPQHLGMGDDLAQPEHAERREPHDHDRAEHLGDPGRAAPLDGEQATRITTAIGITQSENAGVATSKPSTADSTEIAGVIRPSP